MVGKCDKKQEKKQKEERTNGSPLVTTECVFHADTVTVCFIVIKQLKLSQDFLYEYGKYVLRCLCRDRTVR